ncbi:MAG TPA: S41 family peptidase [Stellaceae bacterium]|nr:S41 family peptidase [Stellaceae bacterium]
MSFRPAAALLRVSVAAAISALAACAGGAPPPPADPAARLVAAGLEDVARYYIEPVSDRNLVLAAARGLSHLDRQVQVNETPAAQGELVLEYGMRQIALYPEPGAADADAWARLAGRLVAEARAASPVLAEASEDKIDTALLGGMTGALDRFSRYSPPAEASEESAMRDGFGGVGLTVEEDSGKFLVTEVMPQGPAGLAGVRPQDRIVGIDGVPTAGKSQEAVVDALRGPVGRPVELAVHRPGLGRERDFRIKRRLIVVPTVTVARDGGILIFRIASFNESTARIVAKTLRAAQHEGPPLSGVVLDLRSDPGGLLGQAVALADIFVGKGPIAGAIGRNPASRQYFAAAGDAIAPKLPVVILIDGNSASAAEIVASTLQDVGRAVVVGSASYGKGTVQTVLRLPNRGELILTWAFLITPSGYFLNLHGVVPTVCTSGLGAEGLQLALRRAMAPATASPLAARPRALLDERGWAALRLSCPPRHGKHPIDLQVAKRLISDPALYGEAVRLIAPAPNLAATPRQPGRPAAGPRLTPPERSLLSKPRQFRAQERAPWPSRTPYS